MNRRTLLKTAIASLASLVTFRPKKLFAGLQNTDPKSGFQLAEVEESIDQCRVVVFGSDALRIDTAQQLRAEGVPGLNALRKPICALSGGGYSETQPEWASVWCGMPSYLHRSFSNAEYNAMPNGYHIIRKLIMELSGEDFFPVWITGKGANIKGNIEESPHYQVYESIVLFGHPGVYHGDELRENNEVFDLATQALSEAVTHNHFCCFIHFQDPDHTGHVTESYEDYFSVAREVDIFIHNLMELLPTGTSIIYCSDHGFNFTELGECESGHRFAPRGMMATNFITQTYKNVTRETIGRTIYKKAGYDPDHCIFPYHYGMYGVDL